LTTSPGREIDMAYTGKALRPGEGGEEALSEWMGWRKGRDYEISNKGAFEMREKSRL